MQSNSYHSHYQFLLTTNLQQHVQRAGLQRHAQHGIFHAPLNEESRRGYRVAITARITKPTAATIVEEYKRRGAYNSERGPNGDHQL